MIFVSAGASTEKSAAGQRCAILALGTEHFAFTETNQDESFENGITSTTPSVLAHLPEVEIWQALFGLSSFFHLLSTGSGVPGERHQFVIYLGNQNRTTNNMSESWELDRDDRLFHLASCKEKLCPRCSVLSQASCLLSRKMVQT
jgi:hypothetical protein